MGKSEPTENLDKPLGTFHCSRVVDICHYEKIEK